MGKRAIKKQGAKEQSQAMSITGIESAASRSNGDPYSLLAARADQSATRTVRKNKSTTPTLQEGAPTMKCEPVVKIESAPDTYMSALEVKQEPITRTAGLKCERTSTHTPEMRHEGSVVKTEAGNAPVHGTHTSAHQAEASIPMEHVINGPNLNCTAAAKYRRTVAADASS
jgi:hypothetical protein